MKTIGITTAHYNLKQGFLSNGVNNQYYNQIIEAEGLPVLLPIPHKEDIKRLARQYVKKLDMLLLTGEEDVSYSRYNTVSDYNTYIYSLDKDEWELELIKVFMEASKPIMGVGLGFLKINLALGGTSTKEIVSGQNQIGFGHLHLKTEKITLEGHTLKEAFGRDILVNLDDNQDIDVLAYELSVDSEIGFSEDHRIKLLYNERNKILGVQFCPEMIEDIVQIKTLFDLFFLAATKGKDF
ncbi:gamma-glutamyl-gamma-aminobutyrate hydrolase family protein [Acidaminobacter sp. JC074]|uniref:gamma-glutamyl-gamma-aminobutyrate hydrolase family protein n=1 Tax=Acidaminobacter sp. JC074 TaxID=2530199 RepID=UPI001F1072A5|nr:gamma-glutamyl-gamma-aminobutyrate hydrolase family protein [Acidaminobacter sp. JC074]